MRGLRNKVGLNNILMLIGSLSVIFVSIVFSYYMNYSSAKEIQHAYELKNEIRQIEVAVLNSESSQRGYMLTLEQPYIKPYTIYKDSYFRHYKRLKKLNSQKESLEITPQDLMSLDSLVRLKYDELDKTIRLAASNNLEVGLEIVNSNLGLQYMESINSLIHKIEVDIKLILQEHKSNFDFWNFISIILITLSGIILAFSLFNLLVKLKPIIEELYTTTKSLEKSNHELVSNVEKLRLANIEKTTTVNKNVKLIKSLKGKNKQLDHFAYVASHDLQEPLRTVSNYVEIFQEDYEKALDDDAQMYFGFINDALDRMRNLITGLLNFSRLGTSGKIELVNMNDCLEDIKSNFDALITAQNISISSKQLPQVKGYKIELTQLLQNIISNGIKFRKPDDSPIINIDFTEDEDYYTFSITDNGIGIKEEHIHKIFDMFSRLHSAKDYEGQGIGLAFCKKIVEMHHGEIWVESTYGTGTTFNFTIQKD